MSSLARVLSAHWDFPIARACLSEFVQYCRLHVAPGCHSRGHIQHGWWNGCTLRDDADAATGIVNVTSFGLQFRSTASCLQLTVSAGSAEQTVSQNVWMTDRRSERLTVMWLK